MKNTKLFIYSTNNFFQPPHWGETPDSIKKMYNYNERLDNL